MSSEKKVIKVITPITRFCIGYEDMKDILVRYLDDSGYVFENQDALTDSDVIEDGQIIYKIEVTLTKIGRISITPIIVPEHD